MSKKGFGEVLRDILCLKLTLQDYGDRLSFIKEKVFYLDKMVNFAWITTFRVNYNFIFYLLDTAGYLTIQESKGESYTTDTYIQSLITVDIDIVHVLEQEEKN